MTNKPIDQIINANLIQSQSKESEMTTMPGLRSTSSLIQIQRPIAFCKDYYNLLPNAIVNVNADPNHNKFRFCCNPIPFINNLIPILKWLPNYDFKDNFLPDLVAGCTILALNLPQGLAYGTLAGVEPIYGLYVSMFPMIIYSLFGTSRHLSVGTFAVLSIACYDTLESHLAHFKSKTFEANNTDINSIANLEQLQPIDILVSLCLLVGIIQV